MAPWQFITRMLPKSGLLALHAKIPSQLQFISSATTTLKEDLDSKADELPDYWANNEATERIKTIVSRLLPEVKSWSSSAKMFGDSKGDWIHIWNVEERIDYITLAFSLARPNIAFIKSAILVVSESDCMFLAIQSRKVFVPTLEEFVIEAQQCSAASFLPDGVKLSQLVDRGR